MIGFCAGVQVFWRARRGVWPAFCAALYILALQAGPAPKEARVPDDFKIMAEFVPGQLLEQGVSHWSVTIDHKGDAVQKSAVKSNHSLDIVKKNQNIQLTDRDVQDIYAIVTKSGFMKLKRTYGESKHHHWTMVIKVQTGGRRHSVLVYNRDLKDESDKRDIEAFREVWKEVLRKVPSPNTGKKEVDR